MKTALLYLVILTGLMYGAWQLYSFGMQPAVNFPGLEAESVVQSWLNWGLEIVVGVWVFLLVSTLLIGLFSGVIILLVGIGLFVAVLFASILFPFLFPFFVLGFSIALVYFVVRKLRNSSPRVDSSVQL